MPQNFQGLTPPSESYTEQICQPHFHEDVRPALPSVHERCISTPRLFWNKPSLEVSRMGDAMTPLSGCLLIFSSHFSLNMASILELSRRPPVHPYAPLRYLSLIEGVVWSFLLDTQASSFLAHCVLRSGGISKHSWTFCSSHADIVFTKLRQVSTKSDGVWTATPNCWKS
ncbi:uncharacterized protein EKO05_0008371 [Ascochyta rabiei]|uniref:uncharacterized protein n=1 Tax=Didymella rabiei TaxID=5454 RepID=UPI002207648D|nr:uncharacterized protein EKO05_0008371 [Ascochyta rabiei]UPX18052.1 hypothetical protein EKO05_0008371 [Ascochyta rabiei]